MRVFQNLPIKWKLMLAMMFTGMVALLLLGTALFFAGLVHLRNLASQETTALAEIVGGNCASALGRKDAGAAQHELDDIAANPTVEDACLFTSDGQLFARYTRRDLTPAPVPPVVRDAEGFAGDRLTLYRPVKHDGRPVGTIYLRMDTRIVWERVRSYAGMGILVMGLSMLVALAVAGWLQRFFSGPILELARVAEAVTERQDFTQRAVRLSDDETGRLTEALNKLLSKVQERESGSRASQSRLEKHVAERTMELKRANELLRESEQRLASLIQSAPVGIVIYAADGRITRTNETARKLLGLSDSSAKGKLLSDPAWVFLREDGSVMSQEEFPVSQVLARREGLQDYVVGIRRRMGDLVWVLVNAVPVFDANRTVAEVIISFMDITGRKLAEETVLRRLEAEQFMAFVSSRLANTAAAELDIAIHEVLIGLGRLTKADRSFLFRVSEDLATADNTHEWCAPGVRSQIAELRNVPTAAFPWYLERLRGGEPLRVARTADLPPEAAAEKALCQASDTQSVIVMPIRHAGALVGFIGCDGVQAERDWSDEDARLLRIIGELITDTSERLRAGEALRRSEANLQIALDAAELGPWHWDIVTGDLVWSAECLALYGLPADTAMTYERFLQAIHPSDRARVDAALQEAIEKHTEYAIEKRVLRPDGLVVWIAARGRCSYDAGGRPLRVDGVSFDISERKLAEEIQMEMFHRLDLATRAANAGFWELDPTTGEGYLSPIWKHQLGYADDEISNRFEELEKRLHPDDRDRVLEADRQFAASAETQLEKEFRLRHKDGSYRWILSRAEIKRDAGGRPTRMAGLHIDISERKRAEEALAALNVTLEQRVAERTAALEQRGAELQEAQRVAHIGSWTWELDTGNVTWSDEIYHIFGLDPSQPAPRFREHEPLVVPESMARLKTAAEQTVRTGVPYDLDIEIVRPDSTRRWFAARGEVAARADGRVVKLRGTAQDITGRKQAEEALRQSEEKFRRIVDHIQDVLYSVDMKTLEFRYLSPAIEKMLGYTEEDIRQMGGRGRFLNRVIQKRDMSAEEQARRMEQLRIEPKEGVAYSNEEWWQCKDGTLKCIEDRWIPVYEAGHLVRTEGLLCDITGRKRAEAALRESQERYSSLITNLNVGVYRNTVGEGGRMLEANPALARIFGYDSLDEFMKFKAEEHYQDPADRKTFLECLLSTDSVTGYELRQKKKDGTPIYCAITAAAHRGPNGRVDWIDGIVEDITERKRLEDQLLEISEREQRRIGQDLHDGLCQHLAGVGFMSKALAQKLAHASPAEAADARAVANLIRQAINDARSIAAGLHPVKKEPNAIMVALQELAANVGSMFKVQCVFRCDPPVLIEDNAAAAHIYRIAQEATNNAIRHGKASHIWITLAAMDHRIALIVKDDGKGIPRPLPDVRGIGIEIMNHRARVIGGTLDISPAPDGGTVLTCSFPRTTAV